MKTNRPKIDLVFLTAAERTGDERSDYLNQACGDDDELRARVERLLNAQSKVESFLEFPAPELGTRFDDSDYLAITEKPGTQIGPYKLLQQIGEGGMGVVYMAEQTEPVERRVALKIIKPGMDTRQVIARFEAERQALAIMDHPNIAHVLDVGTTDSGRPFFAMELVKGVPITNYCDEHQLTVHQRLELFVAVCHAVQHAHQKGIIHRDIKPSNVLVAEYDDHPVPKIIDFGVAKATQQRLTEKTMFTQLGQVVGTLEYMSPEQAKLNQLDIDTRSDIYSLGVLLYELLTAETPFDRQRLRSAAFDEMLRILREEEPPRPSLRVSISASLPAIAANRHIELKKLSLLVRGELDWIVMKAMDKNRSRRYDTANAFADDIENYLRDEPVRACPPSSAYLFLKFIKRNKRSLTVASSAVLVLIVVAIGAIISAGKFRDLAMQNADLADQRETALASETRAKDDARTAQKEAELARDKEQALHRAADTALYESYQTQAHALRLSRRPGQRVQSLHALEKASVLMSQLDRESDDRLKLRNEAIAAMGLVDLDEKLQFPIPHYDWYFTVDPVQKHLASLNSTGHISIWRLSDHQQIHQLPIDPKWTKSPRQFTSNGRFLVGVDDYGNVWAWDVVREKITLRTKLGTTPEPFAFSCRDELLAAAAEDGSVHLFDIASGTEILTLPTNANSVSLSSDGLRVAVASDQDSGVQIWDCQSGNLIRTLSTPQANLMAWSPDDRLLACGTTDEYKIVVWNVEADKRCSELKGHKNAGLDFEFSSDGTMLVSASWGTSVRIWDPFCGQELLRTSGNRCELVNESDLFASLLGMIVHLWQLVSSEECRTLRAAGDRDEVFFLDCAVWWGGPVVACAGMDGVRFFNLETKQLLAFAPIGKTESILFHRASSSLITLGPTEINRWPITVANQGKLWRIGSPQKLIDKSEGWSGEANLAQNESTGLIGAVTEKDAAAIFDPSNAQSAVRLNGHKNISNIALSPNGQWAVTGTRFGKGVRVWDAQTGQVARDLWPECQSGFLCYSPDGNFVAVRDLTELRIFNTDAWQLERKIGWERIARRLAWSPDGQLIAIAAVGTVKLINPDTGLEVATITSPNDAGNVESFTFGPDGRRLAITYRHAVEVWDLHRVRRRLAKMDLDWDFPPTAPEEPSLPMPEQIEFELGALASE